MSTWRRPAAKELRHIGALRRCRHGSIFVVKADTYLKCRLRRMFRHVSRPISSAGEGRSWQVLAAACFGCTRCTRTCAATLCQGWGWRLPQSLKALQHTGAGCLPPSSFSNLPAVLSGPCLPPAYPNIIPLSMSCTYGSCPDRVNEGRA